MEANYEVQYRVFGKHQPTGAGAFAEVRPCTHHTSHKLRAVKTIQKTSWSSRSRAMEEIAVLRAVSGRHKNIIEFIEYYEEPCGGAVHLIFEYCGMGNLDKAIEDKKFSGQGENMCAIIVQLLKALECLKEHGVLHRDVKPPNLLFKDDKQTVKLADFGVACFCKESRMDVQGTPPFFAPEVHMLPNGTGYSFPYDMWAAGVTAYMVLFDGKHPFDDKGSVNMRQLRQGEFDVGWLTSSGAADLLGWMLMPFPKHRIEPNEALKHRWFASYGLGPGGFDKERPTKKIIADSRWHWLELST